MEEVGEGNGADGKVPAVECRATRVEGERTWQDGANERRAQALAWKDFVG